MHRIVMQSMKIVVQKAKYIIISYDEVTTIDNQSWCNVHAYIVGGFNKVPLLLKFERVFNGDIVDDVTQLTLRSLLMKYGGLTTKQITDKFNALDMMGLWCPWAYKLVLLHNLSLN